MSVFAFFIIFAHAVAHAREVETGSKGIYLRFKRMTVFYRRDVEKEVK